MQSHNNQISVKGHIADMIYIDIHNNTVQYQSFEYNIYNKDKQIVRRGNFRAPCVQLRTSNLKEGTYQFELLLNGEVWETAEFNKRLDTHLYA